MQILHQAYLECSEYIDWQHPVVKLKAQILAAGASSTEQLVRHCFEFVRDEIKHSLDYGLNPVTCKASEVLLHGTGYCYAKSHLLAALLRANGIPAALCYQRLLFDGDDGPFCLHGLNAVLLLNYGWYRLDARGNKEGVDAQFCPPLERLAFSTNGRGECDIQGFASEPLPEVIDALRASHNVFSVAKALPDYLLSSIDKSLLPD